MKKTKKLIIGAALLLLVFLSGLGAVDYSTFKQSYGTARWHTAINSFIDQVQADVNTLITQASALSTLVTNWAIEDNIVTLVTASPTYVDGDTFTLPGDYTSRFAAGKVVQAQVAAGLVHSTVASSSYGAGVTTVNLNDSVLTNPITRIYVVATRDGLWPNGPGYVVARDYGTPGQTAFDAALAAIGISERTLVLTPGTWAVSADTAVPANVNLKVEQGAVLEIATTKTLTINGPFEAGLYQVFTCVGTGKVVFGAGAAREVYPEWWGANTIPGTTDMTAAIQAAVTAAAATGAKVVWQDATYKITSPITLPSGLALEGKAPIISYSAGSVPVYTNITKAGGTWIDCDGGVGFTGNNLRGLNILNLGFTNFSKMMSFGGDGLEGASYSRLQNIIGLGSTTVNDSDIGIENYNFLFFDLDQVYVHGVNTGLRLVNQNGWIQPGNSVFRSFYVDTYPKTVANGNNTKAGIEIVSLTPSVGSPSSFNMMTFIRPQVNSFNSDTTGIGIALRGISGGAISACNFIDTDIEGELLHAISAEYLTFSFIGIVTTPPTGHDYLFASTCTQNIIKSSASGANIVDNSSYHNQYYGEFLTAAANMQGVFSPSDTGYLTVLARAIGNPTGLTVPFSHSISLARSGGSLNYPDIFGASGGLVLGDTSAHNTQIALDQYNISLKGGPLLFTPLTSAPPYPTQGQMALADRTNWDPLSKGSGGPYFAWYNGSAWVAVDSQ